MYQINVVCGANFERSPVTAIMLETLLEKNGTVKIFNVISTGFKVDKIKQEGFSPGFMKKAISKARGQGLYSTDELGLVDTALKYLAETLYKSWREAREAEDADLGATQPISYILYKAISAWRQEAKANRNIVLVERGLPTIEDYVSRQYAADPEDRIVLGMDNDAVEYAKASLVSFEMNPGLVHLLTAYATRDADRIELSNTFGNGLKDMKEFAEKLEYYLPMVVERLEQEFLPTK